MDIFVASSSSTWKKVTSLFVASGGVWKNVTSVWVASAGVWKKVFPGTLTPSIESTVEISRNNATYPSTLTGTNYHWNDSTSLTYVFQKSSDNVNFTNIGSPASISNPSSGSSNTVTYALTLSDFPAFTSYYRFVVTATNSTYSTTATSTSGSVSVNRPAPINTVAPVISPSSGTAGTTTFSVTNGTWDPDDADGVYEYQWQYYDGGSLYLSISGATSSTYSPAINYVSIYGSFLRCRVTATNASGSTAAFASSVTVTAPVPAGGSVSLSPSGSQFEGTLLTATTSGWSNSPTSYSTRIYASASNPPTSSSILKASSSSTTATYTITTADALAGYYFKAFATAINGAGTSAEVGSNVVTSVAFTVPSAPQNLSRTLGNGGSKTFTWSAPLSNGGAAITSYQYNLDSLGWFTTSSSTSQSLTVSAGSHVFQVRAVNSVGGGTAASTGIFTVPTINSGPSASSITTTSATISWTSSNQESYSLSIPGAPSTPYGGATATSRSITGLSSGSTYTPTLTITSPTGDTATTTGAAFTTSTAPPVNLVAPTISPTSGTAGTTTYSVTSNGTWSPDDSDGVYAYQWQYLDQGSTYLSISGATSSSYFAPSNFFSLGYSSPIRCRVTATNGGGSVAAFSNTATVSAAVSPPSGGSVSLSGTGVAGTNITATTSGWSGSPTSYNLRIYASTSNPPTTSDILKASTSSSSVSYTVTTFDASPPAYYFKAFATATNSGGTSSEVGSNVILSSLGASIPATPTGVTNTYNGGTSYTFSWTASSGATSYSVNYGENTTAPSPNPPASIVGNVATGTINVGNVTSYSYTSSSSSNYVGFRVAAVNSAGTSAYSSPTQYK